MYPIVSLEKLWSNLSNKTLAASDAHLKRCDQKMSWLNEFDKRISEILSLGRDPSPDVLSDALVERSHNITTEHNFDPFIGHSSTAGNGAENSIDDKSGSSGGGKGCDGRDNVVDESKVPVENASDNVFSRTINVSISEGVTYLEHISEAPGKEEEEGRADGDDCVDPMDTNVVVDIIPGKTSPSSSCRDECCPSSELPLIEDILEKVDIENLPATRNLSTFRKRFPSVYSSSADSTQVYGDKSTMTPLRDEETFSTYRERFPSVYSSSADSTHVYEDKKTMTPLRDEETFVSNQDGITGKDGSNENANVKNNGKQYGIGGESHVNPSVISSSKATDRNSNGVAMTAGGSNPDHPIGSDGPLVITEKSSSVSLADSSGIRAKFQLEKSECRKVVGDSDKNGSEMASLSRTDRAKCAKNKNLKCVFASKKTSLRRVTRNLPVRRIKSKTIRKNSNAANSMCRQLVAKKEREPIGLARAKRQARLMIQPIKAKVVRGSCLNRRNTAVARTMSKTKYPNRISIKKRQPLASRKCEPKKGRPKEVKKASRKPVKIRDGPPSCRETFQVKDPDAAKRDTGSNSRKRKRSDSSQVTNPTTGGDGGHMMSVTPSNEPSTEGDVDGKRVTKEVINPDDYVSYEMTPRSRTSEDGDSPGSRVKPIPSWACGLRLKQALIKQNYSPENAEEVFGTLRHDVNLNVIFGQRKARRNRTSSAVWASTPKQQ